MIEPSATMEEHYNATSSLYQISKTIPFRKYVEEYTFFKSVGDLTDMKVLDLACGEGYYTRRMKTRGAAKVVGLDISSSMILLAEEQERNNPIGCSYICADESRIDKIEEFDMVTGTFCINVVDTKELLVQLAQAAFKNIKFGGKFVALVNLGLGTSTGKLQKYGLYYEKACCDGECVSITLINPDGTTFQIPSYYWSKETCEEALQKAGFDAIQWMGPFLDPLLPPEYPAEYWEDLLQAEEYVVVKAVRSKSRRTCC